MGGDCSARRSGFPRCRQLLPQQGHLSMLVLTRRPSEKIIFPDSNITVQVVGVKSRAVRLGIEAPPEVTVLREEVLARAATQQPRARLLPDGAAGPTLCQLNRLL